MATALIAGAGIGGLAAGLALRRLGWHVRIFERAAAPRDVGFGLALAPNAVAALNELGVADAVRPLIVTPTRGEIRRSDGRALRAGQLKLPPSAALPGIVLRPALHGILLDALGERVLELNRGAVRFQSAGSRVRLDLSDGTCAEGDLLVGADGISSTIRAQLHADEPPPRPSGYVAVRGLSRGVGRLNGLHALWYFGQGIESGVVQAGSNEIYWFVSLFADAIRSDPFDAVTVLRRHTAGFDTQYQAITGATVPADMRIDEVMVRDPLARWGAGLVTLLGDAAHPMLPFTGQGAAQALEDAVALGLAMRRDFSDVAGLLRRYESVRSARTRLVVSSGPRIGRITTTRNPAIAWLRDTVIRLFPERLIAKALARPGDDPHRALR